MKRLLLLVAASALLAAPSLAQNRDDITIPEFRQALVDLGSYLDAHKGTHLATQLEAIPDDILIKLYPGVPNPRKFQSAVAALMQHGAEERLAPRSRANSAGAGPLVATPACGAPTTIIEDGSACTPAYPDPTNGPWEAMVNPLITFGAFSGLSSSTDYADASPQGCGLSTEVNLEQVQAGLNGAVDVGQFICAALVPPDPLAIACYVAIAAIGAAGETDAGLYTDCIEQDGLVNAAKIDAAYQNTVTIYDALGSSSSATLAGDISTSTTTLATDISTSTTTLATDISAVSTQLTNVNTQITSEFGALSAQLAAALTQLVNQLTNTTALLDAQLKQVMKENLTPDGQKVLDIPILTCTGINCPNVLATCQAKGNCSWNNVGPLP